MAVNEVGGRMTSIAFILITMKIIVAIIIEVIINFCYKY